MKSEDRRELLQVSSNSAWHNGF